jgi:hypothetical protein
MLCLKQCIDMCDLTPEQASTLSERATLAEVVAAQACCPRTRPTAEDDSPEEKARCALLDQLHLSRDFGDLRRSAQQYQAQSVGRDAAEA